MINLLTPEIKEELLAEEKLKLVLILGIVFIAFLISFYLILFFIKISILNETEVQRILSKEEEAKLSLVQNFGKELEKANNYFSSLKSFYQRKILISQFLEKITKNLPEGVFLTNLNLSFDEEDTVKVSISGFSPNREVLLSLMNNLNEEKSFSEVYFPTENWVKPNDIQFNTTFRSKKQ